MAPAPFVLGQTVRRLSYGLEPGPTVAPATAGAVLESSRGTSRLERCNSASLQRSGRDPQSKMSPWPKRSSGQSAVRTASIPASTRAWCQARAVRRSPKSRTTSQLSKRGSSTWTGVWPGPGAGRHLRGIQSRSAHLSGPAVSRLWMRDAELAQLQLVDRRRRAGQRVEAGGGLREGDHVADRLGAGEALDDAVDAVGDAAVRRRPVAQRLEQEAEARLGRLGVDPERAEDRAAGPRRRGYGSSRRRSPARSRPRRRPGRAAAPGSSGSNSPAGAVNGWCSASQRFSSSFHSNSGQSTIQTRRFSPSGRSGRSARPRSSRICPSTASVDRGACRRRAAAGRPPRRRARGSASASSASLRNLAVGERQPSPSRKAQTRPFAPSSWAREIRPSSSERGTSRLPALMPRTTPPPSSTERKTLNSVSRERRRRGRPAPGRSAGRAGRCRSGASPRRRRIRCIGSLDLGPPTASKTWASSRSLTAITSSTSTNDISTSSWVNSGWRSARGPRRGSSGRSGSSARSPRPSAAA